MKELLTIAESPDAAHAFAANSVALATGARWMGGEVYRQVAVRQLAVPGDAWARQVDAIEQAFAPLYDTEEYANAGLQMLNAAEFTMLASAVGQPSPLNEAGSPAVQTQPNNPPRWLDIGCGTGRIALYAAQIARLTAVDQTAGYVQATAQKLQRVPQLAAPPQLVVAPVERLLASETTQKYNIATAMFGVLNHCQDWQNVVGGVAKALQPGGTFALSMYGSPEAAVYQELARGMAYQPAILTRRTAGGLLLGEGAGQVLPAQFPYPAEITDVLALSGLAPTQLVPFLGVTALYPRQPSQGNRAEYLKTIQRRYGSDIAATLRAYNGDAAQLLVASLYADYQLGSDRVNEAAYVGVAARKDA